MRASRLVTENFSEQAVRLLDEELMLIAPELPVAAGGQCIGHVPPWHHH